MEKLTEVLAMGGYAPYVWPSFIIAAAVMLGMVITSMRSLRKAQKTLAELQQSTRNEA
jgi:heme exporter protein D